MGGAVPTTAVRAELGMPWAMIGCSQRRHSSAGMNTMFPWRCKAANNSAACPSWIYAGGANGRPLSDSIVPQHAIRHVRFDIRALP
jgi:hypothetical protein